MRVALGCVALVAACYQPSVHEGAPCGPGDTCPTGQECRAGTCFFTTTPSDARRDDAFEADTSMVTVDAPPDGPPYIAWAAPVENTSLELPQDSEDDPSVTADKLTVVLSARETTGALDRNIFIGTRTVPMGAFSVTALTAANSTSDENSPEISADGKTIYFTSNRGGTDDVYVSTFANNVWSMPTIVTELSPGTNGDLAVSPDGLTAAVMRGSTIYIHTRTSTGGTWSTGTAHAELSITTDIAAPSITNGAATLYLHAGSPRDIYVSHRNGNGSFQTPVPVAELNGTTTRDAAPFVTQTDDYMIFERDYDIFETSR